MPASDDLINLLLARLAMHCGAVDGQAAAPGAISYANDPNGNPLYAAAFTTFFDRVNAPPFPKFLLQYAGGIEGELMGSSRWEDEDQVVLRFVAGSALAGYHTQYEQYANTVVFGTRNHFRKWPFLPDLATPSNGNFPYLSPKKGVRFLRATRPVGLRFQPTDDPILVVDMFLSVTFNTDQHRSG